MNVKGFKRMLVGEKMPDKDDPQYKKRYENEVEAGRRFAKATRIDKTAAKVQAFANGHKVLFLTIVFGFVLTCFSVNIAKMVKVHNMMPSVKTTATQRQDSVLKSRHQPINIQNNEDNRH